jgi:hypothetical protein
MRASHFFETPSRSIYCLMSMGEHPMQARLKVPQCAQLRSSSTHGPLATAATVSAVTARLVIKLL